MHISTCMRMDNRIQCFSMVKCWQMVRKTRVQSHVDGDSRLSSLSMHPMPPTVRNNASDSCWTNWMSQCCLLLLHELTLTGTGHSQCFPHSPSIQSNWRIYHDIWRFPGRFHDHPDLIPFLESTPNTANHSSCAWHQTYSRCTFSQPLSDVTHCQWLVKCLKKYGLLQRFNAS